MDVLELLRGISNIVVCYCCVQAYVDGINYKILCFLFGFVWTRCVFLFLQFCGIYFDGIFGVVLQLWTKQHGTTSLQFVEQQP